MKGFFETISPSVKPLTGYRTLFSIFNISHKMVDILVS